MFDFHSHILPRVDDGSRNSEESIAMIRMSLDQGILGMAATPHFYADMHSPNKWFERRAASWERLQTVMKDTSTDMKILLGAEVHYNQAIMDSERLPDFRLEGTKMLLVEMPETRFDEKWVDTLIHLNRDPSFDIVIAHIERCMPYQKARTWEHLLEEGILMQSNASNFIEFRARGKAMSLLKKGEIHLLGSDCHNMAQRTPRLGEALTRIEKKLGHDAIEHISKYENKILNVS